MYNNVQSIVADARRKLDRALWDFVTYGAESESTLLRNRSGIEALAWRPRIMRDVSNVDCRTSLFAQEMRIPVLLAPVGSIARFDPNGSMAATSVAREMGIYHIMSSHAFEDHLAEEDLSSTIYALHPTSDIESLDAELDSIERAGFGAVSVATHSTYYGRRERDLINGFKGKIDGRRFYSEIRAEKAGGPAGKSSPLAQAALSWELLDRIRERIRLPLILKGVLCGEDARLAMEHGCDAVYVSNNGGRSLDFSDSTINILGEVVAVVDGKIPVIVDGGFVRGNDVLKAVAIGASAVAIGRLQVWALAAGGRAGLKSAMEILEEEMIITMGYLGVTSLGDLNPGFLSAYKYATANRHLSAFPAIRDEIVSS